MKYGLMLNDMRQPNIENIQCVKVSNNRQELVDFHNSLLVEPYTTGHWHKVFKEGSELEWFNAAYTLERDNDFWGGIYTFNDDVPDEAILAYRESKY